MLQRKDTTDPTDPIIDGLTPAERKVLASALKQVERTLLDRAVKKIRNWIVLATGVLTLFGLVTFAGIKTTIIDEAAKRLADDSQIKTQVIGRAVEDMEVVIKVVERAESLAKRLDTEEALGAAVIAGELQEIHRMIDQVRRELEPHDSPLEGADIE